MNEYAEGNTEVHKKSKCHKVISPKNFFTIANHKQFEKVTYSLRYSSVRWMIALHNWGVIAYTFPLEILGRLSDGAFNVKAKTKDSIC